MTAKIVEKNADELVSVAMAVAPVTDWRFYDSIYTERYMDIPSNNAFGYEKSAVQATDGFKKCRFSMFHGLSDDNVHFQHSAILTRNLIDNDIYDFAQKYFADSDHSISRGGDSFAIYRDMIEFMTRSFEELDEE
jgi:dipeptidyl aminopeptidase